jgi:hypothetical protein
MINFSYDQDFNIQLINFFFVFCLRNLSHDLHAIMKALKCIRSVSVTNIANRVRTGCPVFDSVQNQNFYQIHRVQIWSLDHSAFYPMGTRYYFSLGIRTVILILHTVSQLVEALSYKPGGGGFKILWGLWICSIYLIPPDALELGLYSASNRGEHQKEKKKYKEKSATCA